MYINYVSKKKEKETQEEKIKWKVKLECEQIPKKVRLSWCLEKNR